MIFSRTTNRTRRTDAFTLLEMLVYLAVLMILLGVGYAALYSSMDNSQSLRRSTGDVADALHAGENWRADVRAAVRRPQLETNAVEQILRLPGRRGEVSYRFATNTVFRRLGRNEWSPMLANVKNSTFVADSRDGVSAWRWELELQTRAKKISRVRPLFTFMAVPTGAAKP